MDKVEFRQMCEELVRQRWQGQEATLMPGTICTPDGVAILGGSDSRGIVGFGVASGLTPSPGLLAAISDLNRLSMIGHLWLAQGKDQDNWSLVCGWKFFYSLCHPEATAAYVDSILGAVDDLRSTFWSQVEPFGGRPYMEGMDNPTTALVILMGHLG